MVRDVRRTLSGIARDPRWGFAAAILATAVLTGILAPMHSRIGLLNVGLIYLLLTLLVSATWGWQAGVAAAVITNLAFNFFFVVNFCNSCNFVCFLNIN